VPPWRGLRNAASADYINQRSRARGCFTLVQRWLEDCKVLPIQIRQEASESALTQVRRAGPLGLQYVSAKDDPWATSPRGTMSTIWTMVAIPATYIW
jgi:hypothetical protein